MTTVEAPESHLRENPFQIARAAAAPRGRHLRDRPAPRERPAGVQEGRRRLDPGDDGRRHDPGLRGLPRHPQHRARPVQGRHPLPPGRHARRGQGALDVDDLEVRADEHPVRRRQGRRRLRPEEALARRARAHDPPLHDGDHQRDRPREGHPGARRRHRRLGDGLDLRHLLDEQGPLGARRRHRQAAQRRRLARAARGDRARLALLHPGGGAEEGAAAAEPDRRRAGLRQRRQLPGQVPRRGGRDRDRRLRLDAAACTTRTGSTSPPRSRTSRRPARSPASRAPRRSRTTSCCCSTATCSRRARSSR